MIMRIDSTLTGIAPVATSHEESPRTGRASRLPGHSVSGDRFKQPAQPLVHYVRISWPSVRAVRHGVYSWNRLDNL